MCLANYVPFLIQKEDQLRPIKIREDANEVDIFLGTPKNPKFTFDEVLGEETKQMKCFQKVALPTVKDGLQGFNGTVMAYGQTGRFVCLFI